ncbi:hypothetical protein BGW36DRAFT_357708 [Talaromyces proteolyticus]|uniref:C2H2-type domain-containing protein n=1 Tax=Talaromyces proteolyticus TaxID=1131652 RepID=A0AAD4KW46_9EURO|nr:uncharacterized protein BGW36DRAFT_357708 [Talaromyces proteolyticus]KAH8701080.1 hypothetical protein BGW36DRAFT_357708 [Talaromyces proteolyticus]
MSNSNNQAKKDLGHHSTATGPMPITCSDCGTKYNRHSDFKRHITPKIECPVEFCHNSYRSDKKNQFMNHMRTMHSEIDAPSCERYFQTDKDRSIPLPGLCLSGDLERIHAVQSPQSLSVHGHVSAMPTYDDGFSNEQPSNTLDHGPERIPLLLEPGNSSTNFPTTNRFGQSSDTALLDEYSVQESLYDPVFGSIDNLNDIFSDDA